MSQPTDLTLLIAHGFADGASASMAAEAFRRAHFDVDLVHLPNGRWNCHCERTQTWSWFARWWTLRRARKIAARFGSFAKPIVVMSQPGSKFGVGF